MQYLGGKSRLAKHILPTIFADYNGGQYIEPFVGGGSMLSAVSKGGFAPSTVCVGADLNPHTIWGLKCVRDHLRLIPKNAQEFGEERYKAARDISRNPEDVRKLSDAGKALLGFVGFAYSFGGKWMGGWSRNAKGDDYVARAYRGAVKQHKTLQGVTLVCEDYLSLKMQEGSTIYCDPPYAGTTGYSTGAFNHRDFWAWVRLMTDRGHKVFVSEFSAPKDMVCLWERERTRTVRTSDGAPVVERLFTFKG